MTKQAIVSIRDAQWQVYLATTYTELTSGLKGLASIPPGTGMLFVLPQEQTVTVTTQGLYFPIDIVFISGDSLVVDVARSVPPGMIVSLDLPVKYFLEVNAGEADGIESGDEVDMELVQAAGMAEWTTPIITVAGMMMVGSLMVKMGHTMAKAVFPKKPILYGPRGERLLPQTGSSSRLKELEAEAEELQRKIRAKYPRDMPEPWPEELKRWQGRLWYLGDEILKERKRLLPQSVPEGTCKKCGKKYAGWALERTEHRICKCGGEIEVTYRSQKLPQSIPEGRCKRCGEKHYGWALKYLEDRKCRKCGGDVEITYQPQNLPQTRSTLPPEVSDILLSDPVLLPDKFNLPKGRAMPRTPQQSRRIVDLALKANWGAEQVALTAHHPAWKVVIAFENLMSDEEFIEYQRRQRTYQPQNLPQTKPQCPKCRSIRTYPTTGKKWFCNDCNHRWVPIRPAQIKGVKPARDDVEIGTWAERDRMGIWLTDKRIDKTVAEWWDEDAREMFDQGFFKPGDIRHQTITGRAFEESVLDYAESVGLIAGSGKYLPQTVRDAFYWTAVNKDTGEIVESHAPYTSSGRALQGGRAFAQRHWKGQAQVEVWRQPSRYSEKLKIDPVASELVTLREPAVIPHEPRKPRPGKPDLDYLPDSPEFLAYTIDDIGYRDRIDSAFQQAIARVKGR